MQIAELKNIYYKSSIDLIKQKKPYIHEESSFEKFQVFKKGKRNEEEWEREGTKAGDKAGRFIREYQQVLSIHVTERGEKERKAQYAFKFLYVRS